MTTEFMRKSFNKLVKIAPDDKFKEILQFLSRSYNTENNPEMLIYMVLTMLSMPQYANTYRFLINIDRHRLQGIY